MSRKQTTAPKKTPRPGAHAPAQTHTHAPGLGARLLPALESPAALCLIAVAAALALYWRSTGYEFIDLDDSFHILKNSHVTGGLTWDALRWAFVDLTNVVDYWHPVSWLSLMLDADLYGLQAGGYHATSVILHALNVALVFRLMRRITADKWTAFAVAVLFAVHPMHLESVVWITERKDVLFLFWGLLALDSYLSWARDRSRTALAAFYCCYALSLMSKPVLVVLPGLLLLLDYWPLNRWSPYELFRPAMPGGSFRTRLRDFWPVLREKLPVLGLAILSTVITFLTGPRTDDVIVVSDAARFGNAFLSLGRYAVKFLIPTDLSLSYPFQLPLPFWPLVLSIAALFAALLLALRHGRSRPWLILGLGWFLLGFLTTISIPKHGMQVALADRFTYFPFLGAYLLLVLGAREAAARCSADRKKRTAVLAACLLALLGWYWSQATYAIGFWRNKYTIYERAIEVTSGHHAIYNNYGKILLDRGDAALAETYVLKALALQPNYNLALGNLGTVYMDTGRTEQAITMFNRAIAASPNDSVNGNFYYNLARCFVRLGRYDEAEKYYLQDLAIQPNDPEAHNDLGNIALLRRDLRGAEERYAKAVDQAPDYQVARENLARVRRLLAGARQ